MSAKASGSSVAIATPQPHVTEPSYTIREFCLAERMSTPTYYKLKNLGLGPREMRKGAAISISHRARLDWQLARENPTGAEAEAVREAEDGLRNRSRAAAAKSIKSPRHVSRRDEKPHRRVKARA